MSYSMIKIIYSTTLILFVVVLLFISHDIKHINYQDQLHFQKKSI